VLNRLKWVSLFSLSFKRFLGLAIISSGGEISPQPPHRLSPRELKPVPTLFGGNLTVHLPYTLKLLTSAHFHWAYLINRLLTDSIVSSLVLSVSVLRCMNWEGGRLAESGSSLFQNREAVHTRLPILNWRSSVSIKTL
jgi:hypothetical protein